MCGKYASNFLFKKERPWTLRMQNRRSPWTLQKDGKKFKSSDDRGWMALCAPDIRTGKARVRYDLDKH